MFAWSHGYTTASAVIGLLNKVVKGTMMIGKMMKARLGMMLTAIIVSICMLAFSFIGGGLAYGAEAPAGTDDFDYNGYSASQLKAISECIAGIPGKPCPSYSASTVDHYTETQKHANMPTGVISTKDGWLKWADAAMKANSYDGVYGLVKLSSDNDTTHSVKTGSSTMYFRLVGINQSDRSDGLGKAGLTFQAVYQIPSPYHYHYDSYWDNLFKSKINQPWTNAGGWHGSYLRNSMNNGIIWMVFPSDFKDNVTAVNKITNNHVNPIAMSATVDKLWIMSPSEMGMPIMNGYRIAGGNKVNTDVHVYGSDGRYDDTVKSTDYNNYNSWHSSKYYLYSNDAYQWWMLPSGDRKMSDGNQSYHNTDSYSYCSVAANEDPSLSSKYSCWRGDFWLRSPTSRDGVFSLFEGSGGCLSSANVHESYGIVPAFSF